MKPSRGIKKGDKKQTITTHFALFVRRWFHLRLVSQAANKITDAQRTLGTVRRKLLRCVCGAGGGGVGERKGEMVHKPVLQAWRYVFGLARRGSLIGFHLLWHTVELAVSARLCLL